MSDQSQADTSRKPVTEEDQAQVMQAIAGAVGSSLTELGRRAESSNTALMAFTIMFAAMPETAMLQPERLAAVMGAILKGDDKTKKDVANYITAIINMAQEVPRALAKAEAAYMADQAKAGAGAKPN